jgi:hypothetical protein
MLHQDLGGRGLLDIVALGSLSLLLARQCQQQIIPSLKTSHVPVSEKIVASAEAAMILCEAIV